jgi:lantibiotic modifying enzyme
MSKRRSHRSGSSVVGSAPRSRSRSRSRSHSKRLSALRYRTIPHYVSGNAQPEVYQTILKKGLQQMDTVLRKTQQDQKKRSKSVPKSSISIYTGLGGNVYLYWLLNEMTGLETFRESALSWLKICLLRVAESKPPTFLCGPAGLFTLAVALHHEPKKHLDLLLSLRSEAVKLDSCELLYGTAGYLVCLIFLQRHVKIPKRYQEVLAKTITKVGNKILERGRQYQSKDKNKDKNKPLMWTWHKKPYLGGAHGVAGILYVLLAAGIQSSELWKTVDWLHTQQLASKNYPSQAQSQSRSKSQKEASDELVQFCHGAPGVGLLFLRCYEVTQKRKYLKWAEECGEVVQERGFLTKGISLCHGSCGNAWFLALLFRATGDTKWQDLLYKFANQLAHTSQEHLWKQADQPLCMANGLAGALSFYEMILNLNTCRVFGLFAI